MLRSRVVIVLLLVYVTCIEFGLSHMSNVRAFFLQDEKQWHGSYVTDIV